MTCPAAGLEPVLLVRTNERRLNEVYHTAGEEVSQAFLRTWREQGEPEKTEDSAATVTNGKFVPDGRGACLGLLSRRQAPRHDRQQVPLPRGRQMRRRRC